MCLYIYLYARSSEYPETTVHMACIHTNISQGYSVRMRESLTRSLNPKSYTLNPKP